MLISAAVLNRPMRSTGLVNAAQEWVEGDNGRRRPVESSAEVEVEVLVKARMFGRDQTVVRKVRVPRRAGVEEAAQSGLVVFDDLQVEVYARKGSAELGENWSAAGVKAAPEPPGIGVDVFGEVE